MPCSADPMASVSRAAVAFARVPQGSASAVQPVFVTNLGDAALVVTALDVRGEDATEFRLAAGGTCGAPATLGPGQQCRVDVLALPGWGPTREVAATLVVESNAGTADVRLAATADALLPTPILTSAPDFVEFPVQEMSATSAPRSLVIANATPLPIALARPSVLGGDATDFVATSDCPVGHALAPEHACTVSLTFTPRGADPRSSELVIEFAQGDVAGFHRWSITGTGGE